MITVFGMFDIGSETLEVIFFQLPKRIIVTFFESRFGEARNTVFAKIANNGFKLGFLCIML